MTIQIKKIKDIKLKNPVLIEGLPGIGNVGKIAIDFIIEELKPKTVYELQSDALPHSVFITDDDTVEPIHIIFYALKIKGKDFLLLAGDAQPVDERGSHEFAQEVVKLAKKLGVKEIVTTGGIGRPGPTKKPKVYCVGTTKKVVSRYKKAGAKLKFNVSESVSTIVGATGLLLTEAKAVDIDAISLLVDTIAHPMHLGLEEAKILLSTIEKLFGIKVDPKKLDKDIKESKSEMRILKQAQKQMQKTYEPGKDVSYIG